MADLRWLSLIALIGLLGCPNTNSGTDDDDDLVGDDDTAGGDDDVADDDTGDDDTGDDDAWDDDTGDDDTGPQPLVESFTQSGNLEADLLLVMDNTASMDDELSQLIQLASHLIGVMDTLGLDYHVAVIPYDETQFHGGVVTPADLDPASTLSANIDVGTGDADPNQTFASVQTALSSPLIDPGGPNEGFLRPRAGLRIVSIADSLEASPDPVADYLTFFRSLVVHPDHLVISALADTSDPRIEVAVLDTGGEFDDIFSSPFDDFFTGVGTQAEHWADTFPLAGTPDPATITVTVAGTPTPAGWSHDVALNAVVFDAGSVPANGDLVEIAYFEP